MRIDQIADVLRRKCGRGADTVLVGPPLIYSDERVCLFLCVGRRGQESHVVSIDLGRFGADPLDDPLCQMADTVLHIQRSDEITIRAANAQRAAIAESLRPYFRTVEVIGESVTGGDLAIAERNAEVFPSAAAAQLVANIRAEQVGR